MNKMKKIILTIVIALISIIGYSTVSRATDYTVGNQYRLGYNEFINNSNIFCAEKSQKLKAEGTTYTVISKVTIEGTKSTDYTGKTIYSRENAKLAYILSRSQASETGSKAKKEAPGSTQWALWNYMRSWFTVVGQQHAGLSLSFTNTKIAGGTAAIENEADNYANGMVNGTNMIDNTIKENIKAVSYSKDGKQYMRVGPFNWSFGGQLSQVEVYNQNGAPISEKIYSSFNGTTENWFNVDGIKAGSDFYISIPSDGSVTKITRVTGKTKINTLGSHIWFFQAGTKAWQNLYIKESFNTVQDVDLSFDYNISILGNLKVIKVNKDNHEVKLENVGFYIQNKDSGKYIKRAGDNVISYVDTRNEATEFLTDKNGEISIKNLVVGTYVAYETKNPNYGYEFITNGVEKTIVVDKTTDFVIENKQIYVKLSGYVWTDDIYGKTSTRNDYFKDNDKDADDMLLDGITVRLKDKNGNTVKEAKTANGGAYLFEDVLIENLQQYYIEFEYDGLTYTNVVPHIDRDNGSKSAENATTRDQFNKDFTVVEGTGSENTGITRDQNGNKKYDLSYNIDENAHTSTLINNGQYKITANTNETQYSIRAHFTYGQEEIKYINLGLYNRERPDIALAKDLENVKVAVNGYNHVYNYAQVPLEYDGSEKDGFNVGVKFANKYVDGYKRPIYKADYEYTNANDASKELQVYATYKLVIRNESSNLTAKINSIVDYYDTTYELTKVGNGIDANGEVIEGLEYKKDSYDGEYNKTTIYANTQVEKQSQKIIYVQFKLDRQAVIKVLNGKETLQNVAEINSYSIFNDGVIYAGIDKDSNPGSAVPGKPTTYQDDTDSSVGFTLEVADAREMTGKVFLDSTDKTLKVGSIRQGSGAFEEGEKGIPGVQIKLTENSGSGKEYTVDATDENGDFKISDFIPGNYTLTYIWGDETYTVQHYKGTIYDSKRDQNNKEWYKENVDARLTDALDNYKTRQAIDAELNKITNSTITTIDKMDSATPEMGIGVEYDTTYTASTGDRYVYQIKNVDFGIVERARQEISMKKRVQTFKVTLTNGQVVSDFTIDENGQLSGEKQHITYMAPSLNMIPQNGFVKLELDNELIQGASVEVGYVVKAINNSELDYLSEDFYKYGKVSGNVVTITPTAVIDYLDKDWAFEANKNPDWQIKTLDEIKDKVAQEVNENLKTGNSIILYTESLAKNKLEPTKSAEVMLKVSKILTTSDEISLDNETEVIEVEKPGGSELTSIPGNYVPGSGIKEEDNDIAETVIVTPSTGSNKEFILPIVLGITALITIGAGVVLIKKKILGTK